MVRRVRELDAPGDWTDEPMIYGVDFDASAHQVRIRSPFECIRLTVDALDVELEVSREPGGHLRRRVGKFTGIGSDQWLDQKRLA